jgi:glycerate-2-kinase
MTHASPRDLLQALFAAAVNAAQPEHCIPRFLPAAAQGPHPGDRGRQGLGGHGPGAGAALAG